MNRTTKPVVAVTLTTAAKTWLHQLAAANGMSSSGWIEWMIRREILALEEKGRGK
jgi:hypothetical protein